MRLDRLVERMPSYAGWMLAVSLALTAAALTQIVDPRTGEVRLEVDASADRLLPEGDASRLFYERVRRAFGSDESMVVALVADDVFTADSLRRIGRMTERLRALEGVRRVLSVTNAEDLRNLDGGIEIAPFVDEVPEDPAALAELRGRVLGHPIYAGNLVSADGRVAALVISFGGLTDRDYRRLGLDEKISRIAEEERGDAEAWITGAPRVRSEMARILLDETFQLSALILLALGGVLLFAFRTVRGVLLPLLTIVISVVWTVGAARAYGHTLNAVTALVPPLLTALGLAYSVHVVAEFYAVVREQGERGGEGGQRALVGCAMGRVALPVVLTGLTTAVGFASLGLSSLPAVREFGLLSVVGVVASVLAALSFTPATLALLPPPRRRPPFASGAAAGRFDRAIAKLARFDFEYRRTIFVLSALIFVLALVGASRIRVGTQQLAQFEADAPVRVHFEAVNEHLEGANPFYVVVESTAPDAFQEPRNLRELEALQEWCEAQPEIGGTTSLADYLKLIHRGFLGESDGPLELPESRRLVGQLLLFGAGDELDRFIDARYQTTNIHVRSKVLDSEEVTALAQRVETRLRQLSGHLVGTVTGTAVVLNRALDAVIRGQAHSLLVAGGLIYLLLSAMFVSLRVGLLALIPNVLPVAVYFGALGFTGTRLDTTMSLVAPIVIGIAVDDTIHYFARFIRAAKRLGDDRRATLAALRHVARPVTITSAALCLGFLTLHASELRTQGELGRMAAFALAFAWGVDLIVTPALCARLRVATLWDLVSVDLGREPQRSIPLFAGLRAAQARIVALMASVLQVREGERLYHAGEPGEALYVVIDGALREGRPEANESVARVRHGRGDVVGEVGLFHANHTTDVDVVQDTRLLRLAENDLDQLARLPCRRPARRRRGSRPRPGRWTTSSSAARPIASADS
jgi:predicted RND superfamily exporter protein